ncbi:hypothetical protein PAAG_00137 [Paracoccidioides lutzii Pb01]|uniref:Uncharacterized protein n=1 Tax=Paracoccidioides lutzii (strain ATCC MYA-826 / Pb01) TaxID=502779 RepID=C1GNP2_PARBA|nr:hypothetical protein PAAG_00137 [Paracoccidioides lutzii Pb01]EEH35814.2 hypothetical protein PAAG_00137 [Paracoccidioides lutzii Pb01]
MWKKKHDKRITAGETEAPIQSLLTTTTITTATKKMSTASTATPITTRRFFQPKSHRPAPIDTSGTTTTTTTTTITANSTATTNSPVSYLHSGQRTNSPPLMVTSPTQFHPPTPTSPSTSTAPTPTTHSAHKRYSSPYTHTKRKSSGGSSLSENRRLSGTVNYCGRHGNDWLFGGFSVRESVGKLLNGGNEGDGGGNDGRVRRE